MLEIRGAKKKVISIITARSSSKRLKNKNLLPLNGKPLLAWTINAAKKSSIIDKVYVSTNSEKIKKISLEYGAEVPFMRPNFLSTDSASSDDVLMHFINQMNLKDDDILILLQPTSPLRDSTHIDDALRLLEKNDVNGVVSICKCEHSPLLANKLPENQRLDGFLKKDVSKKRSQDFGDYYRVNGAIYAYKVNYLNKFKYRHYSKEIMAYIMPSALSVDIDDINDFILAEALIKK